MKAIEDLNVKIFADGADKAGMLEMYEKPYIQGLTTNPTLMKQAGITDYRYFCEDVLAVIKDKPSRSRFFQMILMRWNVRLSKLRAGEENVYVNIPVTNTRREPSYCLIEKLATRRVTLNVTALMTLEQVRHVVASLRPDVSSYVSVFAGRVADTGRDPIPLMQEAVEELKITPAAELIWASPRELLNIFQADAIGCHVITVTHDVLKKFSLLGCSLDDYSLATSRCFTMMLWQQALALRFSLRKRG